jgi:cysteinyl-tRNA synthetase
LSGKSLDELNAGERVAVETDKQDPLDFVLWKSAKPTEPEDVKWASPFGTGRPGWHIECSAMACELLGQTFDIHGGGADLQFPHHEDEIAQSEAATGKPFARFWCHGEFLLTDGSKMAKRVGNVATVQDLRAQQVSAAAVRHLMFSTHYRKQLNFTLDSLSAAHEALAKMAKGARSLATRAGAETTLSSVDFGPIQAAWDSLNDDLNTPAALGGIFTGLKASTDLQGKDAAAALAGLNRTLRALGLTLPEPSEKESAQVPDHIRALAETRWQARSAKNWAESDRLRDELAKQGWQVKDGKEGYTLEKS